MPPIQRLHALDSDRISELAELLIDCVDGGALLVALDSDGICGTVQLILGQADNQPHRADLAKMLVHSRARRRGLGEGLMRAAESLARDCGKSLLVLDAVTDGDASRLYTRLGWTRVGDIPDYALLPHGGLCSTTYFFRCIAN